MNTVKPGRQRIKLGQVELTKEKLSRLVTPEILQREEELVVRMLYGLSAPKELKLTYRGQNNEHTRIKLAMIEKLLLDANLNKKREKESSRQRKLIDELKDL